MWQSCEPTPRRQARYFATRSTKKAAMLSWDTCFERSFEWAYEKLESGCWGCGTRFDDVGIRGGRNAGRAVAQLGTGRGRDGNTLRRGSCNRKGSGFRKPCTSCLAGRSCLRLRLSGDKWWQNTIIQNAAQLADMSPVVVRLLMLSEFRA